MTQCKWCEQLLSKYSAYYLCVEYRSSETRARQFTSPDAHTCPKGKELCRLRTGKQKYISNIYTMLTMDTNPFGTVAEVWLSYFFTHIYKQFEHPVTPICPFHILSVMENSFLRFPLWNTLQCRRKETFLSAYALCFSTQMYYNLVQVFFYIRKVYLP